LRTNTTGIGIGMIINEGSLSKKAGISQCEQLKKRRFKKEGRPCMFWGRMQGRQG
jgi:hypothetical protein